jgi:predicted transcriptional regulator
VCDLWNEGIRTNEIGRVLKLSRISIARQLKQGSEIGWCNYNPKEEKRMASVSNGKKTAKHIVQLTLECKFVNEWFGIIEVERKLGINSSSISNALRKNTKTSGGYKWMYKEEYDQYIKQVK